MLDSPANLPVAVRLVDPIVVTIELLVQPLMIRFHLRVRSPIVVPVPPLVVILEIVMQGIVVAGIHAGAAIMPPWVAMVAPMSPGPPPAIVAAVPAIVVASVAPTV